MSRNVAAWKPLSAKTSPAASSSLFLVSSCSDMVPPSTSVSYNCLIQRYQTLVESQGRHRESWLRPGLMGKGGDFAWRPRSQGGKVRIRFNGGLFHVDHPGHTTAPVQRTVAPRTPSGRGSRTVWAEPV